MRDYIIIRHESFQARILLSELHLLDVLHFRRLIKLAERDPWQNGPELDMPVSYTHLDVYKRQAQYTS